MRLGEPTIAEGVIAMLPLIIGVRGGLQGDFVGEEGSASSAWMPSISSALLPTQVSCMMLSMLSSKSLLAMVAPCLLRRSGT